MNVNHYEAKCPVCKQMVDVAQLDLVGQPIFDEDNVTITCDCGATLVPNTTIKLKLITKQQGER